MKHPPIELRVGDCQEIEAFLADRIYEFNSKVTGYFDGESFSLIQRNNLGAILAGISGYTWGGCCFISHLWVAEAQRRQGLGRALLQGAEDNARSKGCAVVLVSSHSFQAPWFYKRLGYEKRATVADHPQGHSNIFYAKRLVPDAA
ncbi:MAG: GNAT family N-acetyltransferase [Halioglobus sp.]